jgi:hypothetical protein
MPWKNVPCALRDYILVEFDPYILNVCGSTSTEVRMREVGLSHACIRSKSGLKDGILIKRFWDILSMSGFIQLYQYLLCILFLSWDAP